VIPQQSFVGIFSWEISIADKRYGKDVDYAVPKGASIPESCIIVFRSSANLVGKKTLFFS